MGDSGYDRRFPSWVYIGAYFLVFNAVLSWLLVSWYGWSLITASVLYMVNFMPIQTVLQMILDGVLRVWKGTELDPNVWDRWIGGIILAVYLGGFISMWVLWG